MVYPVLPSIERSALYADPASDFNPMAEAADGGGQLPRPFACNERRAAHDGYLFGFDPNWYSYRRDYQPVYADQKEVTAGPLTRAAITSSI